MELPHDHHPKEVPLKTKRILEANPTFYRSLGYTAEEIRRLTPYDIVTHDRQSIDRNAERIPSAPLRRVCLGPTCKFILSPLSPD